MINNFKAAKKRRKTRQVMVGNLGIGGVNPIRVQTMTGTDTLNVSATVTQIKKCVKEGAELMRITVPTTKHAQAFGEIKKALKKSKIKVPLIADIHFSSQAAFAVLPYADKIRLNPGNFPGRELINFIEEAKNANVPIRIGTNHGSLPKDMLEKFGNTPKGMVEATMRYLRKFKKHKFENIVVALKATDPLIMIEANRMLVAKMDKNKMNYPIHLGVTEAGSDLDGRAKSTIGIGTLLLDGIGDTIRVSLTEAPEKEIPVCYSILQATRTRITKTEFISCPSCGRTLFDIEKTTAQIKKSLGNLKGVRIAIMGCIVNGLGEMADSDFGFVGGKPGHINLYKNKKLIKRDIPESKAVTELEQLIKQTI